MFGIQKNGKALSAPTVIDVGKTNPYIGQPLRELQIVIRAVLRQLTRCDLLYFFDCPISVGAYLLSCFIFYEQDFRQGGIINEPEYIAQRQQL